MTYDNEQNELASHSRYRHRPLWRRVSWSGVLVGMAIGLAIGLYRAWYVNPVVEFDTEPWQLTESIRQEYMATIALSFGYNSDLTKALERLLETAPRQVDPFQDLADTACELTQTGYVATNGGLKAIRSMKTLYQLQGRTGCADTFIQLEIQPTALVQIELPTPTALPPATKTPTPPPLAVPTSTPFTFVVPTAVPQNQYVLVNVATYCNPSLSGLIEVYVQDIDGEGVPGQRVRVRWAEGEDTFYTGLKPEKGWAYADFTMTVGEAYTLDMPERSEPSTQELVATPCTTEEGAAAITSYRAIYRSNS